MCTKNSPSDIFSPEFLHFDLLQLATLFRCGHLLFTWKTHCGLKFGRSEICTEVSFTTLEVKWTLIMKLTHTEVKFYLEEKSQTGLSSLRVSCKCNLRACLHETPSELKPLWNVVPFTRQFIWRFHCGNILNNGKALMHMCKWYLLIIANLINAKQMLRYWLFFKQ